MRIKWKGGLVLFLFVLAISLLSIWDLLVIFKRGVVHWSTYFFEHTWPLLISVLILPLIFIISISATSKKLEEEKYTAKWLFKFNLIIFLILVILAYVVSAILSSYFSTLPASEMAWLLFGYTLFYAPIVGFGVVALFSIVPSLVYKALYKKRTLSVIFWICLVVSLLLILSVSIYKDNCNFWTYDTCVALKALKKDNIDLCEKIKDPFLRDRCYWELSKEYTDIEVCQKIKRRESNFVDCITNIARNSRDTGICGEIEEGSHFIWPNDRGYCLNWSNLPRQKIGF